MLGLLISKGVGLFRGSAIEQKSVTSGVTSPEIWFTDLLAGSPVASGVSVTPYSAMRCAPVRCAVQAIAETVGQLPILVYSKDASGAKERAPDHPVYTLVHDEPNEWTSAGSFKEQLTRDAMLHGNGYGFIARNSAGLPVEITRIAPEAVTVEADRHSGEPLYSITTTTGRRSIDRRDVLHIPAPSLNGISGDSLVFQARETIGLLMAIEAHAAKLFGNGARPSGILSITGNAGQGVVPKLAAAWNAAHGGSRTGGTAILEGGATYESITMNSVDAQLIEIWNRLVSDIARVFRVPPVLLMDYSRQTWANAEFGGQQFLTYTLARWLKVWEGEIRLKLFEPAERSTYFAEFLIDDLLKADFAQRAESYSKLIAARVLNPNEARAMENRPPYPAGDTFENPNTISRTAAPAEPEAVH